MKEHDQLGDSWILAAKEHVANMLAPNLEARSRACSEMCLTYSKGINACMVVYFACTMVFAGINMHMAEPHTMDCIHHSFL